MSLVLYDRLFMRILMGLIRARRLVISCVLQTNDVFFAVHALVLTILTAAQCLIYEKEGQKVRMQKSIVNTLYTCHHTSSCSWAMGLASRAFAASPYVSCTFPVAFSSSHAAQ